MSKRENSSDIADRALYVMQTNTPHSLDCHSVTLKNSLKIFYKRIENIQDVHFMKCRLILFGE